MSGTRIRRALPSDAARVVDWNTRLAVETEDVVLDPSILGPGVAAALADPARALYWIAEVDGVPAGQVMVTFEWSDWRNGFHWWLQSVYVEAPFRGRGVFRALLDNLAAEAKAAGAVGLRLYVYDANAAAQEVYAKLGFRDAHYRVLERPAT
jgi:GNAT superfamily N-acetyltransferase